jgi:hypothetical protein
VDLPPRRNEHPKGISANADVVSILQVNGFEVQSFFVWACLRLLSRALERQRRSRFWLLRQSAA